MTPYPSFEVKRPLQQGSPEPFDKLKREVMRVETEGLARQGVANPKRPERRE